VGLSNRLPGEVRGGTVEVRGIQLPLVDPTTPDGPAIALVRPEAVTLAPGPTPGAPTIDGTVIATTFLGASSRVTVNLGDMTIIAQMSTREAAEHPAATPISLVIRPDPVLVSAPTAAQVAEPA
jgi:putative spermidine/putrescine transport system ATP-binding protein